MDSKELSYDFAKAWDLSQGEFAQNIANRILAYKEANNKNFKSVYDICCGSSNLLSVLHDCGFICYGTETSQGMYEYSKNKIPDATYFLTEKISDLPGKEKVDIITCTHDVINYFEEFDECKQLFKNVSKKLNKHGIFIFDFYSKFKLTNWNESTYKSSPTLDCLTTVKSGVYDKTVLTYTYYINYNNYYIKTKDIITESYYELETITNALKEVGLKNIQIVDSNLNPIEYNQYAERIYIIASHK